MRVLSVLTALLVVTALYLLVFERERLLQFAGANAAQTVAADAEDAETPEPAATQPESELVSIVAMRSEARQIDGAVIVRGRTEAIRSVELRAETTGSIVSEPLRRGSFVNEDDLLCSLAPGTRENTLEEAKARLTEAKARQPEAEARVAEARANLVEAEINDRAASRLSEGGFASDTRVAATAAAVEAARAGVESANSSLAAAIAGIQSAQAAVASAEDDLDKLEIRAPFAGLLESDTAELGSLLQPGSLCGTIIQLDTIKLVGFIPEMLIDRVAIGAVAGARLSSGREVRGTVTFISRSADPNTRTFRVDVEVENADLSIRDGQTAEIAIQSDGEIAHLLPQSSLTLDNDGRLGVRTVVDEKAGFTPVTVIRDTPQGIWVSGLAPTLDVIVVGQEFVTDGVPVAVTYRETMQ